MSERNLFFRLRVSLREGGGGGDGDHTLFIESFV